MGSVVALDAFRKNLEADRAKASPPRPEVSGAAVWGRDYREVEAIVYGLLQARGLVAHHEGAHDAGFDHLCMNALDAAYRVADLGPPHLKQAVAPLKRWILDAITEDNKRDLSWALVLLDLIEKSPSR
ncbi:hypothetical protein [Pseudodesulfovibrio sp.]|uniref:hypothetical protein n=1 Tax=Pseudodesulfovibrio sp. TaxID=2035812 RepID=UPI0026063B3C|nr:hypothetical protein [Pseudodesulfovibrio sp.]MDD3312561.1 hypothetical protein [Pseudodesulfovibrio sp.]